MDVKNPQAFGCAGGFETNGRIYAKTMTEVIRYSVFFNLRHNVAMFCS